MHFAVIGGGPAGAVTAITLMGRGYSVGVFEKDIEPRQKIGECLTPGANSILSALGMLDTMESSGHLPSVGNRAFWGNDEPIERDFLFGTKGNGWHLDRYHFEAQLINLAKSSGVKCFAGYRLCDLQRESNQWRIHLENAKQTREVEAAIIVDATGRRRAIARKYTKIHRAILFGGAPDKLVGLAGILSTPNNSNLKDRFTVVEATKYGWCYSALLNDGRLVVTLMTDADLLPKGDRWNILLAKAPKTQQRIIEHGGELANPPKVQIAAGSRLERAYGQGWISVGDCALAFDPLSSFGITSAMGSAYYAAQAAADFLEGDDKSLITYQATLDQTWENYVSEHTEIYGIEKRWPSSPFWMRRFVGY